MRLSQAVDELLVATKANGRSERTVADYAQKLAPLVDFLGDPDIDAVTARDLRRYVVSLRSRSTRYEAHPNRASISGGLSPASVTGHMRALRRLFRFANEESLVAQDPSQGLRIPKEERRQPKTISMDDFGRLLAAIEADTVINRRDRALLLVLADSGCRVGGVVRLRVVDIDMDRGTLYVQEKGGNGRYAFFSSVTRQAIAAWLEVRPSDRGDRVFVSLGSRGDEHLSEQGVREVLRRLKRRAKVTGPVNPHSFRHGFARTYLLDGGDLASLARILGHSSTEVTASSYAVFLTSELQAKHRQHSPVEQLVKAGII